MTTHTTTTTPAPTRQPLKLEHSLALLVDAYEAGRFVTTLDALTAYGDTCWHTSVADLRERGLRFRQRDHRHTHRHGGAARFQAYQLTPDSVEPARALLANYRTARGAQP